MKKFKVDLYVVTKVTTYATAESSKEAEKIASDRLEDEMSKSSLKRIEGVYQGITNTDSTECKPDDPRFDIFGYDND